ncbi:MAG: hypothetical protein ACM3O9_05820 [Methylocystaceae bacterium]
MMTKTTAGGISCSVGHRYTASKLGQLFDQVGWYRGYLSSRP